MDWDRFSVRWAGFGLLCVPFPPLHCMSAPQVGVFGYLSLPWRRRFGHIHTSSPCVRPLVACCCALHSLTCASHRLLCVVRLCVSVQSSFTRTCLHVACPLSVPSTLCGLLCVVRRSFTVLPCILTCSPMPCPVRSRCFPHSVACLAGPPRLCDHRYCFFPPSGARYVPLVCCCRCRPPSAVCSAVFPPVATAGRAPTIGLANDAP